MTETQPPPPSIRSSNDNEWASAPGFVEARINYLVPTSERPVAYRYDPPPGVPLRTG